MALYSIGASWNPRMSEPNRSIERGLAGIKGLNFAYRLNTWGPKEGPAMLPANTFRTGMIPPDWQRPPALSGLASPFSWFTGMLGIESASGMIADAGDNLNDAISKLSGTLTSIQTLLTQAQGYNGSSDQAVLGKAQACEAEAAGLVGTFQHLQTASADLQSQITPAAADPNLTKETAQNLKNAVASYSDQVDSYLAGIKQLTKDVADLKGTAQSGPGVTGYVENLVSGSVSKLTWIVGGGLMVYFLAPTFIPRLARGLRKA
jgi:hypothetical protein